MRKFVLIPDSFKGTMSSTEICEIMARQIEQHYPKATVVSIPVADGGEGSVDAFLRAVKGEKISHKVKGPYFEPVDGFYGLIDDGKTAVIEMACCAGLPLVGERKNPKLTTTYGVGELMLAAAGRGVRHMIVGLGGSATNDAGCGAAAAAGVCFYNAAGESFVPTGGTLRDIKKIDMSHSNKMTKNMKITVMCDIDNPMCGDTGAAAVFGPQKGADAEMVEELDRGLRYLNEIFIRDLGKDLFSLPGGGAAGAMGAGMAAFFDAQLQMGIDTVLDTVHFDEVLKDTSLVFSGEGKIDTQSLRGKVVIGVARRAKAAKVPLFAIVGDIGDGIEQAYEEGVTAIFSINNVAVDFEKAKLRSPKDLAITMDNVLRALKAWDS